MTPIQAINGLRADLLKQLNALHCHIDTEADFILEEWAGLGAAGGQREDHAAQYLTRLRQPLEALEAFARDCTAQITALNANPFGR